MTDKIKLGKISYGGAGPNGPIEEAQINFPGSPFQLLSFCCTPIELLSNDENNTVISRGSGFFWKHKGISLLVTNWHVISGRNVFTNELLSKNGFIPSKIRFRAMSLEQEGEKITFGRKAWIISLPEDALEIFENPPLIDGNPVDLCVFPILPEVLIEKDKNRKGFSGSEFISNYVNDHVYEKIACRTGDDCLVLGYPLENYEGLMPPVWKRCSLASEPSLPLSNRPMFLIDGYTTSSMSGSPIFRRVITSVVKDSKTQMLIENSSFSFLGIYSGRLQSKDEIHTGLGYGWYGSLIGKVADYYHYKIDSISPELNK